MLPVEGVAAEEVAVVDEADEEVVVEEAVAGVVAEVVEDLVDAEADEAEAGEEAEVDIKHNKSEFYSISKAQSLNAQPHTQSHTETHPCTPTYLYLL